MIKKATHKESKISTKKYDLILRPIVTEKATQLMQFNKYSFEVPLSATKPEVKKAVEELFKVDVLAVNTLRLAGKKKIFKGRLGQRSDYKKAIVSLKQGQTIDASVGV
ncbi:MAG: 50S ribosomal protein L23 [Alphaproteobacteria bacterium]